TQPVYNPDGTYYEEGSTTNPIGRLNQESNLRDQNTTSADLRFTLEPIKGLRATAFGAVIRDAQNDNEYRQAGSRFSQIGNLNGTPENNLGAGNFLQLGKSSLFSNKEDNKLIAFFGRVNYSFKDRYIAQFILRHEGSSRFGANNKYGDFPAASVGWAISQEPFMKGISFINDLKLRAGYGVTGNQGIPNYQSVVRLGTGNQYLNDDGIWRQTYGPNNNPNPNLRWERKQEVNIGVDFALFG
nr:hypothetical protein [Tanacetum cinerariifolium]